MNSQVSLSCFFRWDFLQVIETLMRQSHVTSCCTDTQTHYSLHPRWLTPSHSHKRTILDGWSPRICNPFFFLSSVLELFFWFPVCEDLLEVIRSMMSNGLGVLSKPTADVSPEVTETVGCSLSMIRRQKWFTAVQCQVARMKLQQVCWMEVWTNFQFCKIPRFGNEVN